MRTTTPTLIRISGWCFAHPRRAIGLWLLALVAVFGSAGAVGPAFGATSDIPDSDSADGYAVLEEHFPELGTGGHPGTIVFRARQGLGDPDVRAAMEELFARVDAGFPDGNGVPEHPGGTVVSPYTEALGSGKLIAKTTLDEATRQQQDLSGYGFAVGQEPVPYYGHSGGAPGMNGDLCVFPQLGYIFIILSNQDPPAASSLADFFTRRMPTQ